MSYAEKAEAATYRAEFRMMDPLLTAVPIAFAATGGLAVYGAAHPRSQLFGPTIRYTSSPRQLALTFDDGPNPAITPRLLDLLGQYQARATFFMIGQFVRECPDLVREVAARGHAVGNHTETHPNLFWLGRARLREELARCQGALAAVLGAPAVLMRPPFGMRNPFVDDMAREVGIKSVVMWTLIPGDWREKSTEWLIRRMQPIADRAARAQRRRLPPARGDVLCLHDGSHRHLNGDRSRTLAALEYWLPRWRGLGLEFVTITPGDGRLRARESAA